MKITKETGRTSAIKMRAWDEGNKVMHYNFQSIQSGNDGNDWIVFTSDKQKLDAKVHPLENPHFAEQLKKMVIASDSDDPKYDVYVGDRVKIVFENDRQEHIATEYCVVLEENGKITYAPSTSHRGLTTEEFYNRYRKQGIQYIQTIVLDNLYQKDTANDKFFEMEKRPDVQCECCGG